MAVSQKQRETAAALIDHWAGRLKDGVPTTRLHLIETAVNATVTARCGKTMNAGPLKHSSGMAIEQYFPDTAEKCEICVEKAGV